jgi:hypothetical protein
VRKYAVSRDVIAGCFDCNGLDMIWHGGNAQGVAARHHDATGHQTWCEIHMCVKYGSKSPQAEKT